MGIRFFTNFSSSFDTFTIVWTEIGSDLLIQRVFLSDPELKSEEKTLKSFKQAKLKSPLLVASLGEKIKQFLDGEKVEFDLSLLDFTRCTEVQKKVLIAEYGIPRGRISTYKRIANHTGITNGARVVGNSLAKNPFPIVIPCHRAIKSNGELGGYQGGIKMKRKLLDMEGIKFLDSGKVATKDFYY